MRTSSISAILLGLVTLGSTAPVQGRSTALRRAESTNPVDGNSIDVADGFKLKIRDEPSPEIIGIADGFRRVIRGDSHTDGSEGVDVADGFKLKARDNTGDNIDVADGFKVKQRQTDAGGEGVDVADGFKRSDEAVNSGNGIDVADGF